MATHPDSTRIQPLGGNFRDIFLPLAGIAETIFTKGRSPGTTAFGVEQIFQQREKQLATERQREEQRKTGALQRRVSEQKHEIGQFELDSAKAKKQAIDNLNVIITNPQSTDEQKATAKFEKFRIEFPKEAIKIQQQDRLRTQFLQNPNLPQIQKDFLLGGGDPNKIPLAPDFMTKLLAQNVLLQERQIKAEDRALTKTIKAEERSDKRKIDNKKKIDKINLNKLEKISDKQIENINGFDESISQLENMQELFQKDFVGKVTSVTAPIKAFTGQISEQQVSFRTAVSAYKNILIKLRSGTAVSAKEFKRLQGEAPNESDAAEVFVPKMKAAIRAINKAKATYFKNLKSGRVDLSGFEAGQAPENKEETEGNVANQQLIQRAQDGDKGAQEYLQSIGVTF